MARHGQKSIRTVVLATLLAGLAGCTHETCPGHIDPPGQRPVTIRTSDDREAIASARVVSGGCSTTGLNHPEGRSTVSIDLPRLASDGDVCVVEVASTDGGNATVMIPLKLVSYGGRMCPNNTNCCDESKVKAAFAQAVQADDQKVSFPPLTDAAATDAVRP